MNRAQRRAAHKQALEQFDGNGRWFPGGPFQAFVYVVRREAIPLLISRAERGDAEAGSILDGGERYLEHVDGFAAGGPTAPLCLTCDETFGRGSLATAILVAVPLKGGPASMCSGVCKSCAGRLGDKEIVAAWSKGLKWPGLQITEKVRAS